MSETLISAAKNRNLAEIKACLEKGANIDFRDQSDRTALIWAASFGFTDIVEYLIKQNANIQHRSKIHNETAFLAAVTYGKIPVLEVLVQTKKISITEFEEAIFTAIKAGNLEVLQFLCRLKTKHEARTIDGKTPFLFAIAEGFPDIVQYLYQLNPENCFQEVDNKGNAAIHIAVLASHNNILENAYHKIIDFLVGTAPHLVLTQKNRANLDAYMLAVKEKNLSMAKYLVSKGAYLDLSVLTEPPQEKEVAAFYNGALELFKILDPKHRNECSKTLQILQHGLNGRRYSDGNTALHLAIAQGYLTTMMLLIHRGATLNLKNHNNVTPYELAVQHQNLLIQITGHIFKTTQLLRSAKENEAAFETELNVTLKKIKEIESLPLRFYKENILSISYIYFQIAKLILDKHPQIAFDLLRKIPNVPGENYFCNAHYKMYHLIKMNKVQLRPPVGVNPFYHRLYRLIKEMIYSKSSIDKNGLTLIELITEYTQEKPENIQRLQGLSELLKQDSIELKKDFLYFLSLISEKNHRLLALKTESQQLKEISPVASRTRLPTLYEDMPASNSPLPSPKASDCAPLIISQRTKTSPDRNSFQPLSRVQPSSRPPSHSPFSPAASPAASLVSSETQPMEKQANSQPTLKLHDTPPKKPSNSQVETNIIAQNGGVTMAHMNNSNPITKHKKLEKTITLCSAPVPVKPSHFARGTPQEPANQIVILKNSNESSSSALQTPKDEYPDAAPLPSRQYSTFF